MLLVKPLLQRIFGTNNDMLTKSKIRNNRGFTLLEVLIAVFITGIISTAAFQFYSKAGHQSEVQYDISEMRQLCRSCIFDIRKTLRSAGYMIPGHVPFEIKGDSLAVYFSDTQPVDTTLYFLQEISDSAYQKVPGLVTGMKLYFLMKQINSNPPVIYADFITNASYTLMDKSNILVSLTTQVPRGDDTYQTNGGFRQFTISERVNIRNVK